MEVDIVNVERHSRSLPAAVSGRIEGVSESLNGKVTETAAALCVLYDVKAGY